MGGKRPSLYDQRIYSRVQATISGPVPTCNPQDSWQQLHACNCMVSHFWILKGAHECPWCTRFAEPAPLDDYQTALCSITSPSVDSEEDRKGLGEYTGQGFNIYQSSLMIQTLWNNSNGVPTACRCSSVKYCCFTILRNIKNIFGICCTSLKCASASHCCISTGLNPPSYAGQMCQRYNLWIWWPCDN